MPANTLGLGVNWPMVRVGAYQVYVSHEGGYLLLQYAGPTETGHKFNAWFNFLPIGEPMEQVYTDHLGQIVRYVHVDGSETRYVPHDCSRTIGTCSYTVSLGYGQGSYSATLNTRPRAGGYQFTQTGGGQPGTVRGTVTLLENGLPETIRLSSGFAAGFYRMTIRAR